MAELSNVSDVNDSKDSTSESESSSEVEEVKKVSLTRRRNKHRPLEISSKKPVGRFRRVVDLSSNVKKRRDPRFDNLSGKFNEDLFEKSYDFLNEYKKSEIEELRNRINKEKDPEEAGKLKQLLSKLQSKLSHEQNLKRKKRLKHERKKVELELVARGKAPFYLKKSEEKKLELVDKFEKIQQSNPKALDKIIEKRRKRNAAKEHKRVPFKRRKDESEIIVINDSSETEIDVAPGEFVKSKKVSTNKVEEKLQNSSVSSLSYGKKNKTVNNFNSISLQSNSRSGVVEDRVTKQGTVHPPQVLGANSQSNNCISEFAVPSRNDNSRLGKRRKINIRYLPYESVPPPVQPDEKLLHYHLNKPLQNFTTGVIAAQNFPKATNGDLHKICDNYSLKPDLLVNRDITKLYQDTSIEKIIADLEDRVMEDMTMKYVKGEDD
ncbi:16645_t:CDS:2 [Acaulospora colombiana]|uniref:16645_t:CDS:1 n=1 Tax=Acaulospora colombiana TaxID=27376 RepID=A0ACA9JXZ0_9GLOM|nr:16645_t:CDS:2 [Acaulospora colombiana]